MYTYMCVYVCESIFSNTESINGSTPPPRNLTQPGPEIEQWAIQGGGGSALLGRDAKRTAGDAVGGAPLRPFDETRPRVAGEPELTYFFEHLGRTR